MLSTKSESDITSLAPSSPSRSPKRPVYYVQSPSRDSHDGDKSSSMQATPISNSPMESPSHPSFGRHSRNSSASRFSGIFSFRSSSGRKGGSSRKRNNEKGWPECNVIVEEGSYDEYEDKAFIRRCQAFLALFSFVLLFTVFCLIIWGASRPYSPEITVKSLTVQNVYVGAGSDLTGVPTKLLTVNGTLRINIYNPATFFGIHVHFSSINLVFSDSTVASGQLKKHYQPRKSHRVVSVNLEGNKVPLYGAGAAISVSQTGVEVPLTLKLQVLTVGNVVGKLVRTKHHKEITCPILINSSRSKPIKFKHTSCTYN